MPSGNSEHHLRLRVFAGPNGSGKSTVIQYVRELKVNGRPIDFGLYINADDIARNLRDSEFSFGDYDIQVGADDFVQVVIKSKHPPLRPLPRRNHYRG